MLRMDTTTGRTAGIPVVSSLCALVAVVALSVIALDATAQGPGQHTLQFDYASGGVTHQLQYLLFLPETYGDDPSERWPLIFFHHGAGENGSNIELIKVHGPPKIAERQPDFQFIVVSPLAPNNADFNLLVDAWMVLLDDVTTAYSVDTSRMYITGLSQGGYLTWELAARHPNTFAAAVPIAGGAGLGGFCRLLRSFGQGCEGAQGPEIDPCIVGQMPVWVFHGDADSVVDPTNSVTMVEQLTACGGDVDFTLYPGVDHDSWTATYDNAALYDWMLSHSTGSATSVAPAGKLPVVWGSLRRAL